MEITETVYVPTRAAWRKWLAKHHASKREIWLIYYKKGSGKPRVEYNDAVEEALCYGWIDGIVKTIDAEKYAQRFTPRKPGSQWSSSNLARVRKLVANGSMTPAGRVHIPAAGDEKKYLRKEAERRRILASRPDMPLVAPPALAAALKKNAKARAFFDGLAPGYKRGYCHWVVAAKQEETRERRVREAVKLLAAGVKALLK